MYCELFQCDLEVRGVTKFVFISGVSDYLYPTVQEGGLESNQCLLHAIRFFVDLKNILIKNGFIQVWNTSADTLGDKSESK